MEHYISSSASVENYPNSNRNHHTRFQAECQEFASGLTGRRADIFEAMEGSGMAIANDFKVCFQTTIILSE
jgi:hypothetical protein